MIISFEPTLRIAKSLPALVLTLIVIVASTETVANSTASLESNDFSGEIQLDIRDSKPDWTPYTPQKAKEDSPNILFVLYDDTGIGSWSPYGGGINMPTLNEIASQGLIYSQWNTTALCSPTRSTLLTGRNHHLNGMATITEGSAGFPGQSGYIPDSSAPLAKILQDNGYSTFWLGKNHNVATQEVAPGASRKSWPLGMGFDRFYGFLGGETNNWYPDLVEDNSFVSAPSTPEEGYHLSKDMADKAIQYLRDQNASHPSRPWYMWFNPGANHAPHHAPKEYADKYKGKFDLGYEAYRDWVVKRMKSKGILPEETVNTAVNPLHEDLALPYEFVRPWDSLSDDEKRLFSRMAEVYAGFSEYTDVQIGRIVEYLKETGEYENTVIIWASDNGASGEGTPSGSVNENKMFNSYPDDLAQNLELIEELGGPDTYNHMPTGWAAAFSGPLKMFKRYSYAGGVNAPLVISWPAGIKAKGEVRHQYHHSVDIVPTILELTGIEMPATFEGVPQTPLSGVSMVYSFDSEPDAATKKGVQYYAMLGTRGIWKDGWKAVTNRPALSGQGNFELDEWELFHTNEDRSESTNLAEKYPEKLDELKALWFVEAEKNNVLPLDDRTMAQIVNDDRENPKPTGETTKETYVYYPNSAPVPEAVGVNVKGRNYRILANVNISTDAAGVIFAHGSRFGGHTLYIKNSRLIYEYNFLGINKQKFTSDVALTSGKHTLGMAFTKIGMGENREINGLMELYIDGIEVANGPLVTQSGPFSLSGEGICVGYDSGDAVSNAYQSPGRFSGGEIQSVEVNVSGQPYSDLNLDMKRAWATE